jgi:hypothetical protein
MTEHTVVTVDDAVAALKGLTIHIPWAPATEELGELIIDTYQQGIGSIRIQNALGDVGANEKTIRKWLRAQGIDTSTPSKTRAANYKQWKAARDGSRNP